MSTQTKVPHTARFLQTFHTAIGTNGRNYRDDNAAEYALAAEETGDLLDLVPAEAPAYRPSPAQTALIGKLILEINALDAKLGEEATSYTVRMAVNNSWTRENTSRWIGRLIAKSNELAKARPVSVPDGRYAVEEEGVLRFFKVKNGRRPGFVFLDVQASDDWHAIHNPARIRKIVAAIAVDAKDAMIRYGQELGQCGRCGKVLTSEYRNLGLGPVCIEK